MIHIVFNEADVKTLESAIELDESLAGKIVQVKDDYAVGPINNLYQREGIDARREWWRSVVEGGDYQHLADDESIDDYTAIAGVVGELRRDETEEVWIWAAQNKHDVSGYYFLLYYLKEFQGRVQILYLNNLPFINEKGGIFYPTWISEIPPKEFLKAKKLARPITLSEFEVDPDEWQKLASENRGVRLLEGGKKIASKTEDFYDNEIIKNLTGEWQKATRVLSNTLNRMKIKTGDIFVMWRMRSLMAEGKIEVMGDTTKGWKDFDVKLPGGAKAESTATAAATA
ncbi:MAG: DUF1835 domain-containing protein [Chitinophagaceae bacterium]|nr:MAG: DUF1835 domain-containing protein [Chitinophagaceae bacterium]